MSRKKTCRFKGILLSVAAGRQNAYDKAAAI